MQPAKNRTASPNLSESDSHRLSDAASHSVRHLYAQGLTDPRQVRSAQALREALLRLLERKEFDQITVKEIASEAKVHQATFFRHHADKEALLDHVAADEINHLVEFSLPQGHDIEGHKALCEYVSEHRTLWRALLNGGAGAAMRKEYLRISKGVAEHYVGAGSWLPQKLAIVSSTMLIIETISWWLEEDEGSYSVDDVAEILDKLAGVAISKSPPRYER